MDNFDIGETKRANENRWLYTIGPQRRTRYPFETLVIPGTHYTLHWFMQCKITDPSQVPEFKYVPISTGATTLPFGTAPYVPTVQISQTKSDWVVVPQDPYLTDAKVILQCLAKCLNQHNFTIFDARDLTQSLSLKLPLISHEETLCELDFLERQKKGIVIGYQNRHKRKLSPVKLEDGPNKRPRFEVTGTSSATRMLLDLLSNYGPISISQAALQLQVKESLIEKVVDVLMVVGHLTVSGGLITSTQHILSPLGQCPGSPKSPTSSCEESYGPIPETPPQAMPMWDAGSENGDSDSSTPRPYATRSSTKAQKRGGDYSSTFTQPPPVHHRPMMQMSSIKRPHSFAPPPTEPARPPREEEPTWTQTHMESYPTSSLSQFSSKMSHELDFESNLDLADSSLVDFFQSSFWDQY